MSIIAYCFRVMPQQRDNGGVGEGRGVGAAFPSERDNKDRREKTKRRKKRNAVSAMSNLQAPAEEERQSKLRLL